MPRVHVHAREGTGVVVGCRRSRCIRRTRGHRVHRTGVFVGRRRHREPRELPVRPAHVPLFVSHRREWLEAHPIVSFPSQSKVQDDDLRGRRRREQRVRRRAQRHGAVGHLHVGQPRDGDAVVVVRAERDDVHDVHVAGGARRDQHGDVRLIDAVRAPSEMGAGEIWRLIVIALIRTRNHRGDAQNLGHGKTLIATMGGAAPQTVRHRELLTQSPLGKVVPRHAQTMEPREIAFRHADTNLTRLKISERRAVSVRTPPSSSTRMPILGARRPSLRRRLPRRPMAAAGCLALGRQMIALPSAMRRRRHRWRLAPPATMCRTCGLVTRRAALS